MMEHWVVQTIIMFVAIEAITEIIVEGDIFFNFRNFLARKNPGFLGKLFSCGYCVSVWVAVPFGLAISIRHTILLSLFPEICKEVFEVYFAIILCVGSVFFMHRISNVVHEFFKRFFDRYPFVLLHQKVKMSDALEAPPLSEAKERTEALEAPEIPETLSEAKESTQEAQDDTTEKSHGTTST